MDCISHDSSNYKGKNAQLKNSLSKNRRGICFYNWKNLGINLSWILGFKLLIKTVSLYVSALLSPMLAFFLDLLYPNGGKGGPR